LSTERPAITDRTAQRGAGPDTVSLLLVEDDPGDAFLVEELLRETALPVDLKWVRSLAEAGSALTSSVQCVLLDLALPDADGLEALPVVLAAAPGAAVLVLTGLADEYRGGQAVAAGAQDYLVKGQVDGELLSRAIRFAIERKRADEAARQLHEAELWAKENARLERGLLPLPLLDDAPVACLTRYQPGRQQALLGGDFYDAIATPDGRVFALVGDVMGHGPDGAALGVCLRIAWRTLVLADTAVDRILSTLNEVIIRERRSEEVFATVCMFVLDHSQQRAQVFLAGHPPPIGITAGPEGAVWQLPGRPNGPALGLFRHSEWPPVDLMLGSDWSVMMYTDGLIEGRVGAGEDRLGEEGLVQLVSKRRPPLPIPVDWPDAIISAVEWLNGGPLTDDVAVLIVSSRVAGS
jgi:serine phosphatase RsbU (regulator of sigma subunit)